MNTKIKRLEKLAFNIIKDSFSNISEPAGGLGHRVDHSIRAAGNVKEIIKLEKIDVDQEVVLAAAILHDIGDVKRIRDGVIDYSLDVDHAKEGYEVAKEVLSKYKIDSTKIEKIADIIKNHHNHNSSNSYELKLVQDGDLLEELGYLNIWQMFSYSANTDRNLNDTLKYWNKKGRSRKLECVENCNFKSSKKIAKEEFKKMDKFLNDLR